MKNMKNELIKNLAKNVMNLSEKAINTYSIGACFYEPKVPVSVLRKEK